VKIKNSFAETSGSFTKIWDSFAKIEDYVEEIHGSFVEI